MHHLAVLFGLSALGASAALSAELTDFVPAENGAAACWQRIYSAEHLAAHPDQQVAQMTLSMTFDQLDDEDPGWHYFALAVSMRDGRNGTTSGGCFLNEDMGEVQCSVDCDGGGLALELQPDGAVMANLETYGYIRLDSECGGGEGATFPLEAGLDDKLFLLPAADAKQCKGLVTIW